MSYPRLGEDELYNDLLNPRAYPIFANKKHRKSSIIDYYKWFMVKNRFLTNLRVIRGFGHAFSVVKAMNSGGVLSVVVCIGLDVFQDYILREFLSLKVPKAFTKPSAYFLFPHSLR